MPRAMLKGVPAHRFYIFYFLSRSYCSSTYEEGMLSAKLRLVTF